MIEFRRVFKIYILIGTSMVVFSIIGGVGAPLLSKISPTEMVPAERLIPPSKDHLFGTDEFGRDVFSRALYGMRTSLGIAALVVALTSAIGIIVGLVAGYYRIADHVIGRILDAMMSFPAIIIAISLASVWGAGKVNIILSMSFAFSSRMARIVRASTITLKDMEYVESARAAGASDFYVLFKYILPNILSPIIVQATMVFATAIIVEATLSFLGIGIKPPAPTLGGMLSDGRNLLAVAPWLVIVPGVAILIAALGFNLLGDGLRDILDPRLKE